MNLKLTLVLMFSLLDLLLSQNYDVYLSNNVVYNGWDFQKIFNNEVYIKKSVNNFNFISIEVEHFPVESIIKIHPRRHPKSVTFGCIGFTIGALLNSQAQTTGSTEFPIISGASAIVLMGLMVGSIPAGVGLLFDIAYWTSPRSRKIDLSQMTLEEKVNVIQTIISTR